MSQLHHDATTLSALMPVQFPEYYNETFRITWNKKDLENLICRKRAKLKPEYEANEILQSLKVRKDTDCVIYYEYLLDGK